MNREQKINHIIKTFKNIGPQCAPQLLDIGVETIEDLQKIGAEEAFFQIWQRNPMMEINAMYMYALEGAIQNINCLALDAERKKELRDYAKSMRESI